jgi:Domain of unknown function (DUF1772)
MTDSPVHHDRSARSRCRFAFLDYDAVPSEKGVEVGLILAVLATLPAGLFAGAAAYVTFVEHPARVSCGVELAVIEFGPSYKRATVMQASLALVGTIAGIGRWGVGGGLGWLVASVMLGAVVPFTLVVILPTNNRLLDASLDKASRKQRSYSLGGVGFMRFVLPSVSRRLRAF